MKQIKTRAMGEDVPKYIKNLNDKLKYEKMVDELRLFKYPFIGSYCTSLEVFELKQVALENIEMSERYITYLDSLVN